MKYKFEIFYDKNTGKGMGIKLKDGTIIIADKKAKGIRVGFPKKKFLKMFKKQLKEKRKYLGVIFSYIELNAIQKAFNYKKKNMKTNSQRQIKKLAKGSANRSPLKLRNGDM